MIEAPRMGYLFFYEKIEEIHEALNVISNDFPEEQVQSIISETNLCQHKRHISENSDDSPIKDSWKKTKEDVKDTSKKLDGNFDKDELEEVFCHSSKEENEMSSLEKENITKQTIICRGCGKSFKNIRLHLSKSKDNQNCEEAYTSKEIDDFFILSQKRRAASQKKYVSDNPEKRAASIKKYISDHPEKRAASQKKYQEKYQKDFATNNEPFGIGIRLTQH